MVKKPESEDNKIKWEDQRLRMVSEQLRKRRISDERVLYVMEKVPRHLFVPAESRTLAYADGPLPIGEGQTVSQPYMVAVMTQQLNLKGGEKILEIGIVTDTVSVIGQPMVRSWLMRKKIKRELFIRE